MKKIFRILIAIGILIIAVFLVLKISKENKGEEIENALEDEINYVEEQQKAFLQARELYFQKKGEGMQFSSQCLGTVGDKVKYVVDIVHVPRATEDNKPENQCEDYRNGKVKHFIELDKKGNIVRVV